MVAPPRCSTKICMRGDGAPDDGTPPPPDVEDRSLDSAASPDAVAAAPRRWRTKRSTSAALFLASCQPSPKWSQRNSRASSRKTQHNQQCPKTTDTTTTEEVPVSPVQRDGEPRSVEELRRHPVGVLHGLFHLLMGEIKEPMNSFTMK